MFHEILFMAERFYCKFADVYAFSMNFASRCVVSGSGKIAMHVLEKLIAYGAVPVTVSGKFLLLASVIEIIM